MFAGCSALFFAAVAVVAIAIALRALGLAKELQRDVAELKRQLEPTPPEPLPEPEREPEAAGEAPAATPGPEPVIVPPLGTQLSAPRTRFDVEQLVGVKLFSWIAGVALVLAAVFFLSYSVQHGWISAPLRAAIGIATGLTLLGVCELRVSRDYKLTADALDGAGIAILYATLFAMYALWHLLGATTDFILMLAITAIAVSLSIRRNSPFIALLGLLGGFATPALLSSGDNRPIALFSYLLLLNIGLAWVASTKRWPVLTAISIVLTAVYEWTWIARFLTVSQFPLAATIFALFAITAASALWLGRGVEVRQPQFDYAAIAGAAMPLAFAMFAAAVPAYGARFDILFAFLLLVTSALGVISIFREPAWLHLAGGATSVLVFLIWFAYSYTPDAWPALLAWIAAFVVVQLAIAMFHRGAITAAPLLFVLFPVAIIVARPEAASLFATIFVLLAIVAAYAVVKDAQPVYVIAGALVLLTESVWIVKHDREGLAIVVAFALLFVAVPVVARKFDASALLALGAYPLLMFVTASWSATTLFVALALIGPAAAIASLMRKHEILMDGAALGSQLVLIAWAANTHDATTALVATLVVAAAALVCFGVSRTSWRAAVLALSAGFVIAIIAGLTFPAPSLVALGVTHVLLLVGLLVIRVRDEVPLIAIPLTALATALARTTPHEQLLLAAPVYAIFIAFALLDRRKTAGIAAVLASGVFFVLARPAVDPAVISLLPLVEAAVLGVLLWRLRRLDPVVAGGALAFVAASAPLQFASQWIVMTLALEAAALLWLRRRAEHSGLLAASTALYALAFAWLMFVHDKPALLVCAAAFYAGAWLIDRRKELLASGGTILLFIHLNIEIADLYAMRAALARDLAYTMAWALFAIAMLVAGIAWRSRGNRIAAIVLLLATVLKCFLHDLARLGGLYRVGSLLGLALSLVLVGVLLQRFVRSSV